MSANRSNQLRLVEWLASDDLEFVEGLLQDDSRTDSRLAPYLSILSVVRTKPCASETEIACICGTDLQLTCQRLSHLVRLGWLDRGENSRYILTSRGLTVIGPQSGDARTA